jgi:hypothetical protein
MATNVFLTFFFLVELNEKLTWWPIGIFSPKLGGNEKLTWWAPNSLPPTFVENHSKVIEL